MTELAVIFARLGLEQYLDSFIVEGFDTWLTVLDIQEGDLDALNVKLGHRRKLQREIANHRGLSESSNASPPIEALSETGKNGGDSPTPSSQHDRPIAETKRKYRRHPKPDKNAPERPPSAYVIFSNMIREEVRGQNLSFTEIAKFVGDRWQNLKPEEKEPFESQANASKEKFNAELARYKKTDFYKAYTEYVADFKAKHSANNTDGKRPKLELESNGPKGPAKTNEIIADARTRNGTAHLREVSTGSTSSVSLFGGISSPNAGNAVQSPAVIGYSSNTYLPRPSSSPNPDSPMVGSDYRDPRIMPLVSAHGPVAMETHQTRCDVPNVQSRTGQLTLACLSYSPVPPAPGPSASRRISGGFPLQLLQQPNSSASSGTQSDSSGTPNALPATPTDEPQWRCPPGDGKVKGHEWPRIYNPLPIHNQSTPFGHLASLPQVAERTADRFGDLDPRALPLPVPSPPRNVKGSFMGHPHSSASWRPPSSSAGSPKEAPLENSEEDAANTLAVLAFTGR